jgi:hypothetical protein
MTNMTSEELGRTMGELFDLRDHFREAAESALGSDPDLLRIHLSALRTVPDRIDKAVADYIKTSMLPIQLKPQDLLDLFRRSHAAMSLVGLAVALQNGDALEGPALSAARYMLPELLTRAQLGTRASVLRWLLIDLWDLVPDATFDAAMAAFWDTEGK